MKATPFDVGFSELERAVESLENARRGGSDEPISKFLPDRKHDEFLAILQELVRIDLEFAWESNRPKTVESYRAEFPELFGNREILGPLLFEEYRLRRNKGEEIDPREYERKFGIDTGAWPGERGLSDSDAKDSALEAKLLEPTIKRSIDDMVEEAANMYWQASLREDDDAAQKLSELEDRQGTHAGAEFFSQLHRQDPTAAHRISHGIVEMPRAGRKFLGFRLVSEIGHGAFSRVFAARQKDLGDRLVVLKISADVQEESRLLSRLQHTNIVPVYSVHTMGSLQAVCMPFYGTTTLADVVEEVCAREEFPHSCQALLETVMGRKTTLHDVEPATPKRMPTSVSSEGEAKATPAPSNAGLTPLLQDVGYVEAITWMGSRLADALAHAHERGITHRDIKPANVLIQNDGQPMLLDFNLSRDTNFLLGAAKVGGTLPFMAPEQLRAMLDHREVNDPRCDIFSLGVVLYILLAKQQPFPLHTGRLTEFVPKMIDERMSLPASPREKSPLISAGLESIVMKCLEPDPSRRYQHARDLETDLRHLLENLPLQFAPERSVRERATKWIRRHPKLASGTTVGVALGLGLIVLASFLVVRNAQLGRVRAKEVASETVKDARRAQQWYAIADILEPTIAIGDDATAKTLAHLSTEPISDPNLLPIFGKLDDGERRILRSSIANIYLYKTMAISKSSRVSELSAADAEKAKQAVGLANQWDPTSNRPFALFRLQSASQSSVEIKSAATSQSAVRSPQDQESDSIVEATELMKVGKFDAAIRTLKGVVRKNPDSSLGWIRLATCHFMIGQPDQALSAANTSIALEPDSIPFLLVRAVLEIELRLFQEALDDLDVVMETEAIASVYFNRAIARASLGKIPEAIEDYSKAIELGLPDTRVYFQRSRAYAAMGDAQKAQEDFRTGMSKAPTDAISWSARGFNKLMSGDASGALVDFQSALKLNPADAHALRNSSHIYSEYLRRPEDAIATLTKLIALHPESASAFSSRGVLYARLGRRDEALRDARAAEKIATDPLVHYQIACIYALNSRKDAADANIAIAWLSKALAGNPGMAAEMEKDPDLAPIQKNPALRTLLDRAKPGK